MPATSRHFVTHFVAAGDGAQRTEPGPRSNEPAEGARLQARRRTHRCIAAAPRSPTSTATRLRPPTSPPCTPGSRPGYPVHGRTEARSRSRLLPPHDVRVPGRHPRLGPERTRRWRPVRRSRRSRSADRPRRHRLRARRRPHPARVRRRGCVRGARSGPVDVFVVDTTGGSQAVALTAELRAGGIAPTAPTTTAP